MPTSKTGQEINQWFSPTAANWTNSYNPGQVYNESALSLQLFRPEVIRYLETMGFDQSKLGDQQAYDQNGNPVQMKEWDLTKSILDNPDAFMAFSRAQGGAKGSEYLNDFLKQNNLGVRYGNQGKNYVNQLYNTQDGSVLASDVNEDKENFMQKNGWMIPLAALGGIAAGGAAMGASTGAIGTGSSAAQIAGVGGLGSSMGGAAAAGGGLLGAGAGVGEGGIGSFGSIGEGALSPINAPNIGSLPSVGLDPWTNPALPSSLGGGAASAGSAGDAAMSAFNGTGTTPGWENILNTAPTTGGTAGDVAMGAFNGQPGAVGLFDGVGGNPLWDSIKDTYSNVSNGKTLIDKIKESGIGQAVGSVADAVGGGGNLAGLIGAGLGAASGSGDTTATRETKMDPRMDQYVYGKGYGDPASYLGQLQAQYLKNPSGINSTMQQGLDTAKNALTDPAYAASYQQMRNFGTGLLSPPMAGNPFTQGQAQMPTAQAGGPGGLLGNYQDRAKALIARGGGLIG